MSDRFDDSDVIAVCVAKDPQTARYIESLVYGEQPGTITYPFVVTQDGSAPHGSTIMPTYDQNVVFKFHFEDGWGGQASGEQVRWIVSRAMRQMLVPPEMDEASVEQGYEELSTLLGNISV